MKRVLFLFLGMLALASCGGGGGGGGGTTTPPVVVNPLVFQTTSLAEAQVDIDYSYFLTATGGRGSYTWSVKADSPNMLPDPMFVNPSTGEIKGLPQAGSEGAYVLRLDCFDGVEHVTKILSMVINARLSVSTTIVPAGTEGVAYSRQLNANGGFSGKTWSVDAASPNPMPTGLSLSASGLITGVPTVDGSTIVRVAVSDGTATATRDLSFVINDAALQVQSATLPVAQAGVAYAAPAFQAIGGSGSYAWSVALTSVHQLPPGLGITAGGVISGTPQIGTDGFYNIFVQVDDGVRTAVREFVLQIGTPAMEIVSSLLADGEVAEAYSVNLMGGGGTSNYQWSLAATSGPLPSGLTVSQAGVISGVPVPGTAGTHSMLFRLFDGVSTVQKTLSITILEADLLDTKFSFSAANINHFLTRAQFGSTEDAQAAVTLAGGLENYVDQMLSQTASPTLMNQVLANNVAQPSFPSTTELARWYEQVMVLSDAPFQESLALFWHDHFATSTSVLGQTNLYFAIDHINTLRNGGLGNFRQLLFDVAIDKHMLIWLDGVQSYVGRPNENFAREFWELFTVGIDNGYTQADIVEASRVFTGFRTGFNGTQGTVYFQESRHDKTDKHLFGRTIKGRTGPDAYLEYMDMVDLTLEELDVAEYITRKLWEWFAYLDPEQEIIDGLSKTFRDNNWEIRPVLRQMFLSNAFYAASGVTPRAKSPVEYAVGMIRSTQLDVPVNVLDSFLILTGQRPTDPPDVSGWPSGQQWLSADAMVQRANFAASIRNERSYQAGKNQGVVNVLPPLSNRSAPEVVDHMAGIFNLTLTVSQRNIYIDYLNTNIVNNVQVGNAFDGANQEHLEERARGLLYIMAQHPDYNFR